MRTTQSLQATGFDEPVPDDVIVRARDLRKSYASVDAVKGVDIEIKRGEVFGFIGPDGAGKTSIFHILGGVMEPTSGKISVLGRIPRQARLEIGYLTQQFSLYLDLSVEENIRYVAGLRQVPEQEYEERKEKYLTSMNLAKFRDRLAGQLSGGMKQKLFLCCALIARPKLLLLDEPTTGVDPVSRREFWDLLSEVGAEGITIAVATPYLDEAERCNRVVLMHEGLIRAEGSPRELRDNLKLSRLEVRATNMRGREPAFKSSLSSYEELVTDIQPFGDRLDVLVREPNEGQARVEEAARSAGVTGLDIAVQDPTLENVFVLNLRKEMGAHNEIPFPFVARKDKFEHSSAIRADKISKRFGDFQAVKEVTLNVNYGEIYGLLGANGAGKTTTIKMLCGLLETTTGTMQLAGRASNLRDSRLRQRIGYMSQKFTLYEDLTVLENLQFYSGVYEVPSRHRKSKIDWALKTSDLAGQEGMLVAKLPGGWQKRLSFAACVMHEPEIIFLDEPTSGVDPLARLQLWQMIDEFAVKGTAILVTTHFLEEAEHCQQLAFMVAGEVVAQGTPSEIKDSQPGHLIEVVPDQLQGAARVLKPHFEGWQVSIFADKLHLVVDDPEQEVPQIRKWLEEEGIELVSFRRVPFSLEDAFIGIVERAGSKVD